MILNAPCANEGSGATCAKVIKGEASHNVVQGMKSKYDTGLSARMKTTTSNLTKGAFNSSKGCLLVLKGKKSKIQKQHNLCNTC